MSFYWDGESLNIEPYSGHKKHYFCGKELLRFDSPVRTVLYTILVLDLDECCCADVYSDGEIVVLFQDSGFVPHKHRCGGQSAHRFEQLRRNAIVQWFKDINDKLMKIEREIILGISFAYRNQFIDLLHTYNKNKIKEIRKTEYTNISGIYQMVSEIESE